MNYASYYRTDVLNGPGIRAVLFVQGCIHSCPGCYNKTTWNPRGGFTFDKATEDQILQDLKDERIIRRGLTLTGGDPLHADNIEAITALVKRVREECPDKDIWCWTGYTLQEINEYETASNRDEMSEARKALVELVDVLVDGKFEQEKYDPSLKWRGSSNQNIIEIRNL